MRFLPWLLPALLAAQSYDVVLRNGRVLDPESRLDGVRNVGIAGKKIAALSIRPLRGKIEIDATGLVIAPGFIDLHSHGQTPENYRYKAMDGVTTALELEVGVSPVSGWYTAREGKALIHYGASAGHIPARMAVMHDSGGFLPRDAAANRTAASEERKQTYELVRQGLDEGGLGIGLGIEYTPKTTREEILELFELAAQRRAPIFVHMRKKGPVDPGAIDSLQEVLADALVTGATIHVVHLTSMGLRETPTLLHMIDGARRHGIDVTTETHPYTAQMTDLSSAIFEQGWQRRYGGITYKDLQWAATGERLTGDSFARYRKLGGMVIIHSIPEEMVRLTVANSMVMIASDGLLEEGRGHPRGAGTYARILGRYVREQKALSLMDAVRKSSLLPAQRLEGMSPQMRRKGRLKVGSDADIAVFDAEKVIDRATFENPAQYSEGFRHVLVEGSLVVRDGKLQEGVVAPGQAIRAR